MRQEDTKLMNGCFDDFTTQIQCDELPGLMEYEAMQELLAED